MSIPHAVLPAPIPSADSVLRSYLPTDLEHPIAPTHNLEVAGSNPVPSTEPPVYEIRDPGVISFLAETIAIWPTYPKFWQEVAM